MQRLRSLWSIARDTYDRYQGDHGGLLGAGLAFYALLSIAPLMILTIGVAGLAFERQQARAELLKLVRSVTNHDVATDTANLLALARQEAHGSAAVVALAVLVWAASRLFTQLQVALNVIWGVRVKSPESNRALIRRVVIKRAISVMMVLACGATLLILVLLDSVMTRAAAELNRWADWLSVPVQVVVLQNIVLSLGALTLLFAAIYRVLPDARIPWRDVWMGAIGTAVLVLGGTALLSLYLGNRESTLLDGAVGSVAAFTLWAYYLAQVFLFGAAFTRTWSDRTRGRIEPEGHAELEAVERGGDHGSPSKREGWAT